MATRRRYLVCYDIADEKRLRRVARILKEYGRRLQYSVFECLLADTALDHLKANLAKAIDADEDQVMFVILGAETTDATRIIDTLGLAYSPRPRLTIV
ncbi:MAG TPA: CRISPR-associated endonuclease Cas2 [Desulfobulbaceae bacterium]|nr:CRISPR-associated endonuclease Cas2 [Desulfobulbaceae bacterium]